MKMSPYDKRSLVSKLISGVVQFKFNNKLYISYQPTYDIIERANCLYDNIVTNNRFGEWLDDEKIEEMLIKQGLWDKCNDIRIKRLTEVLDDYKVDLYKSYCTNPDGVKRYKRLITQTKSTLSSSFRHRYSFERWTLYHYAENIKQRYLAMHTLYCKDIRVYDKNTTFKDTSFHLLNEAVNIKTQLNFNDDTLRYLVRKDPFKTLWAIGKPNPFKFHLLELNEGQKLALVFSKMYENIQNSPECPPDDVVDDDDALDGWLVSQSREHEKQKLDTKVRSTLTAKQQSGGEIFLPAKNVEDAKKINQLNSPEIQMVKKQRQSLIKQKGVVNEKEFLDNRLDQQVEITHQFKNKFKGK